MSQLQQSNVPSQVEDALGEVFSKINARDWNNAILSLIDLHNESQIAQNEAKDHSPQILFPKWERFIALAEQLRIYLKSLTKKLDTLELQEMLSEEDSPTDAADVTNFINRVVEKKIQPALLQLCMIRGEIKLPLQLNFTQ
jgi:hypothetical protein